MARHSVAIQLHMLEEKNHEKLPYRKKKYYYQWWAKSDSSAGAELASLRYQHNTLQSL